MNERFRKDNVAPDSRLKTIFTTKGAYQREFLGQKIWMVPAYCLNCGALGPDVPEQNTRSFHYLCNNCVGKHGVELGTTVIPDQVFWNMVHEEALETYGRGLTHEELFVIAEADASPLATLLNEGRNTF